MEWSEYLCNQLFYVIYFYLFDIIKQKLIFTLAQKNFLYIFVKKVKFCRLNTTNTDWDEEIMYTINIYYIMLCYVTYFYFIVIIWQRYVFSLRLKNFIVNFSERKQILLSKYNKY